MFGVAVITGIPIPILRNALLRALAVAAVTVTLILIFLILIPVILARLPAKFRSTYEASILVRE